MPPFIARSSPDEDPLDHIKRQLDAVTSQMTRLQILEIADFLYAEARMRRATGDRPKRSQGDRPNDWPSDWPNDWRFEIRI